MMVEKAKMAEKAKTAEKVVENAEKAKMVDKAIGLQHLHWQWMSHNVGGRDSILRKMQGGRDSTTSVAGTPQPPQT